MAHQEEIVCSVVRLVAPQPDDLVFELGSGDGRFLVAFATAMAGQAATACAQSQQARVIGFELDTTLASLSRSQATAAGLSHLVEVREEGKLHPCLSSPQALPHCICPNHPCLA